MEVTVLLMFGLVLVLIQIILVRRITFRPIPWFTRMAASARLESPYAYGGFLFIVNMVIFLVMTALVVLTIMMNVAFSLFLFAGAGVFISFMIWIQMSVSREGTKKEKRIIGGIGSAFYWVLTVYLLLQIFLLPPSSPEQDPFMQFVGLLMGVVISLTAAVSCWVTVYLAKGKPVNPITR